MEKDFDNWNDIKKKIDNKTRPYFHEREIWFANVGLNIGFEQNGKGDNFLRPILVIKKFNNEIMWGIPMTGSPKTGRYYFLINSLSNVGSVVLSQLRLVDCLRLEYKIGSISAKEFVQIKEILKQFLT